MCRNIRTLHNFEPPASEQEVQDAALQYVRKISGSTKPSHANAEVFERAVAEVTAATQRLLDGLVTTASPKDREVEAAKRRARSAERFAACDSADALAYLLEPSRLGGAVRQRCGAPRCERDRRLGGLAQPARQPATGPRVVVLAPLGHQRHEPQREREVDRPAR